MVVYDLDAFSRYGCGMIDDRVRLLTHLNIVNYRSVKTSTSVCIIMICTMSSDQLFSSFSKRFLIRVSVEIHINLYINNILGEKRFFSRVAKHTVRIS